MNTQGPQSHAMRKLLLDESGKKFAVAMFLCFSQHSQFCILRPHMVDGQFTLDHAATVYAPEVGWQLGFAILFSLRDRLIDTSC